MPTSLDLHYINRCLELAHKGLGTTYPNPLVGCVIVHNNKIIGEGFHYKSGSPHAEVLAIQSVKNKELLSKSTLYVNLEPCNHYGKTPPCTQLIIEKKIKKIVITGIDYNPIVSNKGIEQLKANKIEVKIVSDKTEEHKKINKRFFTFHTQKRPYIILKWAQTKNGFIDDDLKTPATISTIYSQQLSHKWRTEEQAILVGKNTIIKDNPQLNARLWKGEDNHKIFIDKNLNTPKANRIYSQKKVIIFNSKADKLDNVTYIKIDFTKNTIPQILEKLYLLEIQSVIIEGGEKTIQSFIDNDLWDEARVFTSKTKKIIKGIKAPKLNTKPTKSINIDTDRLSFYYNGK